MTSGTLAVDLRNKLDHWRGRSPDELLAEASQRLPIWVSLALAVLIAWYAARLVWLLIPSGPAAVWEVPAGGTGAPVRMSNVDYSALRDAHLFGEASAQDQPVADQRVENAPETRLNLKLRGAIMANEETMAHAIIADGSGNERVYFVKDQVPGGARLHQVEIDRVILNRAGALESLRLPKEFQGGSAPAPRRQTNRTSQPSVRQVMNNDPARLTDIIRPQPFMPNGQLKGYRIFPGRNRQQFSALGLRPGDLVTEINGIALNNPAQGMEAFRSLGDSTQVTVTLERDGQSQVMTLDTSQLSETGGATQ